MQEVNSLELEVIGGISRMLIVMEGRRESRDGNSMWLLDIACVSRHKVEIYIYIYFNCMGRS